MLREPDEDYLCGEADRAREPGAVFPPFEEDGGMLSVIVSKAFPPAADDRITDPAITALIRRGR